MINIVKQCISNNSTWRFVCCNIRNMRHSFENVCCNARNVKSNCFKCIASQCLFTALCDIFLRRKKFWHLSSSADVHATAKHVISRRRLDENLKMYKNDKRSCKARKTTVSLLNMRICDVLDAAVVQKKLGVVWFPLVFRCALVEHPNWLSEGRRALGFFSEFSRIINAKSTPLSTAGNCLQTLPTWKPFFSQEIIRLKNNV